MRRSAGASWSTSSRAPGRTAPARSSREALEAIRAEAPRGRRAACAPPPRARSRRCRCRSACSNISPPTSWRCRRRCSPRRRSTPRQWQRLLARRRRGDAAVHRDASSRSFTRRAARRARPRRWSSARRADAAAPTLPAPTAGPSLHDVVARIERRRRSRAAQQRRGRRRAGCRPARRRCSAGNAGRAARSPGSKARRAAR